MELEPEMMILDRKLDFSLTINEHTLSLHLRGLSEAHKAGMITLFAHLCVWPIASSAVGRRRLCCLFLKQLFRLCLRPSLRLLRRGHPSPASSRQAGQPCCGRRHGHPCMSSRRCARGFRELSWKGCLRASFCRCKTNFRGLGVYVPRSVDWHPAWIVWDSLAITAYYRW